MDLEAKELSMMQCVYIEEGLAELIKAATVHAELSLVSGSDVAAAFWQKRALEVGEVLTLIMDHTTIVASNHVIRKVLDDAR